MESESKEQRRYYLKEELKGLVSTLRDLFDPRFRKMEKEFARHWKDVLQANPFLTEVFNELKKEDNWKHVVSSVPGKIEITFLPPTENNKHCFLVTPNEMLVRPLHHKERRFLEAPGKLWTLFISLPRGCIQELDNKDKELLWGAEVPSRFYFGENPTETEKYGAPQYELLGMEYPYR